MKVRLFHIIFIINGHREISGEHRCKKLQFKTPWIKFCSTISNKVHLYAQTLPGCVQRCFMKHLSAPSFIEVTNKAFHWRPKDIAFFKQGSSLNSHEANTLSLLASQGYTHRRLFIKIQWHLRKVVPKINTDLSTGSLQTPEYCTHNYLLCNSATFFFARNLSFPSTSAKNNKLYMDGDA